MEKVKPAVQRKFLSGSEYGHHLKAIANPKSEKEKVKQTSKIIKGGQAGDAPGKLSWRVQRWLEYMPGEQT